MSSKLHDVSRTFLVLTLAPALALSVAVSNLGAASPAGGPRVLTNKSAYVAGERVLVSGHGFLPFEVVTLQVEDGGRLAGTPWSAVADNHGRIESSWIPGDAATGADLVLTATGGSSRAQVTADIHRTAILLMDKAAITGSHFEPRENVSLRSTPDGESWVATADDEGTFTSTFPDAGAANLEASGEWSGLSAITLLVAGGFAIDGNIPDSTALQFGDPYGSSSELGPVNTSGTKLLPINSAAAPMLSFTNPNAQVDLRSIWMATSVVSGDAWLYFAWERDSNSGSGVIAFEFQQAARPAACDYTKTDQVDSPANSPAGEAALIASCNPWANRQAGDFLIVWDSGGGKINIIKRTFYLDGQGKLALDSGVTLSATDSAAAVSADKYRGEGAINLSRTVFPQNPTSCFSIANIIPGTVTGNSDTADYKDTLLAEFASRVAVSNCGQVKVTKATQPAGGTGSFPYTLARTGGQPVRFVDDGGNVSLNDTLTADQDSDTHLDLIAGTNYTLTEGAVGPAWATLGIMCGGTNLTSGGTFTVLPSVLTECTITNKLQNGTLIVKKVVINDDGGTAACGDFGFKVNGGTTSPFEADCQNELSVDSTVPYTVTEPAVAGYATTYSNCSNVQVPAGGSATCTVTNDDRSPSLRLVKSVTNNNGGSATAGSWQLTATGTSGFTDAGNSSVFHAVKAGVQYTLSESSVAGYDPVGWSCDGGTFAGPNKVTLGLNQQVTCTITNDDRKATPGVSTTERAVLHDAATVSGIRPGAPAPAATVTFRLYSDATCTTQVGVDETVGISAGGQATTVNGVLVNASGTYYWRAFYSGDTFNAAFATACGSEITTVGF